MCIRDRCNTIGGRREDRNGERRTAGGFQPKARPPESSTCSPAWTSPAALWLRAYWLRTLDPPSDDRIDASTSSPVATNICGGHGGQGIASITHLGKVDSDELRNHWCRIPGDPGLPRTPDAADDCHAVRRDHHKVLWVGGTDRGR